MIQRSYRSLLTNITRGFLKKSNQDKKQIPMNKVTKDIEKE